MVVRPSRAPVADTPVSPLLYLGSVRTGGDFDVNSSFLDASTVLIGPAAAVDLTLDLGLLLGLLIGLLGIALAIFLGLRAFTGGIGAHLNDIKSDLKLVAQRLDDIWALRPFFGAPPAAGTVHRQMEHLGAVTISARPSNKETEYVVEVEKPIVRQGLIVKLSAETGFGDVEKRIFGSNVPRLAERSGNSFLVHVPTTDAKIATEYMTLFLEWLDTEYVRLIDQQLDDFEAPILGDRA